MDLKVRKLLALFVSLAIALPLYVLLHEGGHALTALFCGARITRFSLLEAYTAYEGGRFTAATLSLFHAAGVLLPAALAAVYMLSYRSRADGLFYRIFSFMVLLFPVGSLLAWVAVPPLCLLGRAPEGDDAAKFIETSGWNPWAVAAAAAALFIGCLLLAWKKKIVQNYWAAVSSEG